MEQTPTEPLMMLVDHEAQEVFPYVLRKYQNAHLVMMKGIRYITITDDAIRVILDRLQRERADFKRTVEYYDREIQGVEYLLTGKKRYYKIIVTLWTKKVKKNGAFESPCALDKDIKVRIQRYG